MTLNSFKTPFKKYVTWKGENMVDEKAGEKRDKCGGSLIKTGISLAQINLLLC